MSRHAAIAVLCGFSILALALAFWGITDIKTWLKAVDACDPQVVIDTSSFWFLGAVSIAGLLLLTTTDSVKAHKFILVFLVAFFIVVPVTAHHYFVAKVKSGGYETAPITSPFTIGSATLVANDCR